MSAEVLEHVAAQPAAIALSPAATDFGERPVGSAPELRVVTVTNLGPVPIRISGWSLPGSPREFYLVQDGLSERPLPAGASGTIWLEYRPKSPGPTLANLSFNCTPVDPPDARAVRQTIALRGVGLGPGLAVSADKLDLGATPIGEISPRHTITLTNTGNQPAHIRGFSVPDTPRQIYLADPHPRTIAPHDRVTIELYHRPRRPGPHQATLTINSDAPGHHQVDISAMGLSPELVLSADKLDLGATPIGEISPRHTITLTNTGNQPAHIRGFSVPDTPRQIYLADPHPRTIAPHDRVTIELYHRPRRPGPHQATLTINSDAPGRHELRVCATGVPSLPDAQDRRARALVGR